MNLLKRHPYITQIDDPNRSEFNLGVFKENLRKIQEGYHIGIAERGNPHKRSAKRISILVSEAYLTLGGSIHWVQDLEAEVYKLCKECQLDCDPLEMESADRSYLCKYKKSNLYGRKIAATKFDNHKIRTESFSREDMPLARAVIHLFVYNYYIMEDRKNGTTYYPGKGIVRTARDKQSKSLPIEERKRIALCKPNQNREGLSSRKIHGVGK